MKNIRIFYLKNFHFLVVKFSIYLNRRVFVMFGIIWFDPFILSGFFYLNSLDRSIKTHKTEKHIGRQHSRETNSPEAPKSGLIINNDTKQFLFFFQTKNNKNTKNKRKGTGLQQYYHQCLCHQWKLWSDCTGTQAEFGPCSLHMNRMCHHENMPI